MKNIKKEKNKLVIQFDYNSALVELVKQFEGRKYVPKTKEWTIPIVHVKEVVEKLLPLGFEIEDEILNDYTKITKLRESTERIHNEGITEEEIKRIDKTGLPCFDFQKIGATFLDVASSGLCGDEPGTGKTIQSIALTKINNAKKNLIICPPILRLNWKDEIDKWLKDVPITIITGTKAKRDKLWQEDSVFYIMNYELLLRDLENINKIDWDYLISDESTRISNPKAKQSKAIKTIKAKHRIALTGTPLTNAIKDVWSILDFCQPGCLGSYWQFTEKYCIKDPYFGNVIGYKNLDELKKTIRQYMIRRLKSDVLKELPPKLFENIYIEQTVTEKKVYNAIKENIKEELEQYEINNTVNNQNLNIIMVKMVRFKQATGSLALISDKNESSKLETLKELLGDIIHGNSKAIIFTQFAEMAKIMMEELTEYKPLLIAGKEFMRNYYAEKNLQKMTSDENRIKFQNEEENKILISTDAGGVGLNLFRANYVIHFDLPWSIEKLEQREDRAHRIGQKLNVTIYKLIVSKTIDEYVLKTLHKKQKLSANILGDKDRVYKVKITKRDIKNLLL